MNGLGRGRSGRRAALLVTLGLVTLARSESVWEMAERAGALMGLPAQLMSALVYHESRGNQSAVSRSGALGLAQLMPKTAAGLNVDPRDAWQNVWGGARYLRQQLDQFGSVEMALAAYNAGPGAVLRYGGIPPYAETQAYVRNIMGTWSSWGGVRVAQPPTPALSVEAAVQAARLSQALAAGTLTPATRPATAPRPAGGAPKPAAGVATTPAVPVPSNLGAAPQPSQRGGLVLVTTPAAAAPTPAAPTTPTGSDPAANDRAGATLVLPGGAIQVNVPAAPGVLVLGSTP